MAGNERWQARAAALEAMGLLVLARILVARVPLAKWLHTLGQQVVPEPGSAAVRLHDNLAARRLARAIERASSRLPGVTLCLPRAMVLQWMIARRGLGSLLIIGVRPKQVRGGLGDLHAWVVRHGEILIGALAEPHHPLFGVVNPPRPDCRTQSGSGTH